MASNVNPCFLISHLILNLSYTSYDVGVKSLNSEQIHVLGFCRYLVAQYGRLFKCSPALYVHIKAYYRRKTQQLIPFNGFKQLKTFINDFFLNETHPFKYYTWGL